MLPKWSAVVVLLCVILMSGCRANDEADSQKYFGKSFKAFSMADAEKVLNKKQNIDREIQKLVLASKDANQQNRLREIRKDEHRIVELIHARGWEVEEDPRWMSGMRNWSPRMIVYDPRTSHES